MANKRTVSYILARYLKGCDKQADLSYALCRDWHEYMDFSITKRYRLRGMALAIVEAYGPIPPEVY
ncbi:gp023 [Erwinia phage vB_EamP-S6]|uniref:Gp023 n=1 Tax=Erwinia phage vB_EamP-S6 TaxID=1051675 RepID=G0YQB5_9CAUD|nr:gp023 [Erwinia phage vB_EamP-S6]AEJ81542.1 gp023 [Erwinia phage vB_EamP-S6]